ncbi:MAG: RAMP superfamily CRISPR-associated protein [Candidatus Xenobiia bacterium LiM19]
MQQLKYRITTLSPVLFSLNGGDLNTVNTFQFIPGSTILGAFAREWIQKNNLGEEAHRDTSFHRWFLSDSIHFGNAYIILKDENDRIHLCYPIPFSIQEDKERSDIYDLLFKERESELQTNAISGFADIQGSVLRQKDVRTSLNFHHSRDNEKGISREGQIFNYLSIDKGQSFEGILTGPQETLDTFLKAFSSRDGHIFHLGRSRNTQYGKVNFEFLSKSASNDNQSKDLSDSDEISLTLLSDAIVYNDYGYPTTEVKELEKILGVKITKSFVKSSDVENYVSTWHLKKPSENCFRAGSCFLLETPLSSETQAKLSLIEASGIGERRNEGFGQCVFNMQREEKLKKREDTKPINKPSLALPDTVKKTLTEIYKDTLVKAVELDALKMAKEKWHPLPTKSLIGRLESMMKVMERNDFIALLNDDKRLRKTAKDKLHSCRTGSQTLHSFLTSHRIDEQDIKQKTMNNDGLKEISETASINYEKDTKFQQELYRLYLLTFFSAMRKKANRKKEVAL